MIIKTSDKLWTCVYTSVPVPYDCHATSCHMAYLFSLYTTLTPQIKGNHRVFYIVLTTGQYLDIALWLGRYHDIALTTTAFDAEAATKHQFPLIIYIEMLKVLHCGFELQLLKVLYCRFELNMLI